MEQKNINIENAKEDLTLEELENVTGGKMGSIASNGALGGIASNGSIASNGALGGVASNGSQASNGRLSGLKSDGTLSRF